MWKVNFFLLHTRLFYRRQGWHDNKPYIYNGNAEGLPVSPLPSASLHCRYRHRSCHCPLHLCIANGKTYVFGNAQMQRAMVRPMSVTAMQRCRGQWRVGTTLCIAVTDIGFAIAVTDIGFVVLSVLPSVNRYRHMGWLRLAGSLKL